MRSALTVVVLSLSLLTPPPAHGFCIETPTPPGAPPLPKVAWALMPVAFRLHDTGSGTMDKTAEFGAVRAAFQQWEDAPCTRLDFQEGELLPAEEMINLQHTALEIRVYWARTEEEWSGGNPLAIARTWYNYDPSGNLVSGAMLLNSFNKQWSTTNEAGKYDVQSVVATEVGRVIGLATSLDTTAVMSRNFSPGSIDKRTLKQDDLNAVAFLYPEIGDGGTDDGGTCPSVTPDTACPADAPQTDGGTPTDDGGVPSDGGTTVGDGGGPGADAGGRTDGAATGDAGGQACTDHLQCPSGICGVDHFCVPPQSDSGCSCHAATSRDAGLLLLALSVTLVLGARRRTRR